MNDTSALLTVYIAADTSNPFSALTPASTLTLTLITNLTSTEETFTCFQCHRGQSTFCGFSSLPEIHQTMCAGFIVQLSVSTTVCKMC